MSTSAQTPAASQTFTDRILYCVACKEPFVFTAGEQRFYQEKELQHEPRRCRDCRLARKLKKERLSGESR